MSEIAANALPARQARGVHNHPLSSRHRIPGGKWVFLAVLLAGLAYLVHGIHAAIASSGQAPIATSALVLLGIALAIALGFEFVNGFHDTANAVATVIYTRSLPPTIAVVWSGLFNFLGVLTSTGAVAYSIVTLLPFDLVLNAGGHGGTAMIFALLLAAIIWNLVTWAFGIPNSSSHALIGSILGVGLANQLLAPAGVPTASVPWDQAKKVIYSLLLSPLIGFVASAVLLLVLRALVKIPSLYAEPHGERPPPGWIRGLLIATCTGVSFTHGSNDGQKGMGLIMLILIGAAPTAFALNRAVPDSAVPAFIAHTEAAEKVLLAHAQGQALPDAARARETIADALKTGGEGEAPRPALDAPQTFAAAAALAHEIEDQVRSYGSIAHLPAETVPNMRNDMYLASETVRKLPGSGAAFTAGELGTLKSFRGGLENGTRFIPVWVKVAVAIALGLGTMVGWKRIVQTVGERIGKKHLTYAQGATAELVAMGTIGLADNFGMPVSTTHVLSSGVAGTMAAAGAGLQGSTLRNMALAWVLTLPVAMLLAGGLFTAFRQVM